MLWLTWTPEGRAILKDLLTGGDFRALFLAHASLIEGLFSAPVSGPNQGLSPLHCLAGTPEGRAILKDFLTDGGFRARFLARASLIECLFSAPVSGPNQGVSLLYSGLKFKRSSKRVINSHR